MLLAHVGGPEQEIERSAVGLRTAQRTGTPQDEAPAICAAESLGVRLRDPNRVEGGVDRGHPCILEFVSDREGRIALLPVPTSRTVRGRGLERQVHEELGLGPRDEVLSGPPGKPNPRRKSLAAEDVGDRFAPDAAPHHLRRIHVMPRPAGERRARLRVWLVPSLSPGPAAARRQGGPSHGRAAASASDRGLQRVTDRVSLHRAGQPVRDALEAAIDALEAAGCETARLDAEVLLAQATGWDRAQLAAEPDARLPVGVHAIRRDGAAPRQARAGRLHPRPQGFPARRAPGRPEGPDPEARDRAPG